MPGTFIDDEKNRFYLGINPAVVSTNLSSAQNRVESVGFPASVGTGTPPSEKAEPGVYLVICNVRECRMVTRAAFDSRDHPAGFAGQPRRHCGPAADVH